MIEYVYYTGLRVFLYEVFYAYIEPALSWLQLSGIISRTVSRSQFATLALSIVVIWLQITGLVRQFCGLYSDLLSTRLLARQQTD